MKQKRTAQINSTALIVAVAVVIAAAGGVGFYRWIRPTVDVTEVVQGPVVQAFYATGTVSAQHEYSVRASTAGIIQVRVDKGAVVKKGDVLAVVDSADLKFAVDQASAELHRKELLADEKASPVLEELRAKQQASQELLDIAMKDQKRMTDLMGNGATAETDLDQSMNRVKAMWSDEESYKAQISARKIDLNRDAEVARAALDSAKWELDQATVHSPIDGTVLDWPISNGTRVAINDHILQLADVTPAHLVMRAQVDEEDKNLLRPPTPDGQRQMVTMTLYAYPNAFITGSVDKIYDKADPDRRTYEVDVTFDTPDPRLAAGMTGELNFLVAQRDKAIIVPAQAVQNGNVMIVRDGALAQPNVVIGIRSVERAEIVSGLELGDHVVISPTLDLQPGQSVREHHLDPYAAAQLNAPKQSTDNFKGFK